MTPEEEQQLLMSLLTQRPYEDAQETTPLEAERGRYATQAIDIPWTNGGEPAYRVPTNATEVGSQQEASAYMVELEQRQAEARQQAEYERYLDELLNRPGNKTGASPYGTTAPPPWRQR